MPDAMYIIFLFALGACVGSFLNVVVWRLPRGESLVKPPSHCPKCGKTLKWYDNLPVVGWIKLGGKCRFCGQPISSRYPIVEAITGLLFVFYYVMFFIAQLGPCLPSGSHVILSITADWPMYFLYMFLVSALLASSLIDAELFIIPLEITWWMAGVGLVIHTVIDRPTLPGALNLESSVIAAASLGAGTGLLISIGLWYIGKMPQSFPQGEPMLDIDREMYAKEVEAAKAKGEKVEPLPPEYTSGQIRLEMTKEMLFLSPPMLLAIVAMSLVVFVPGIGQSWTDLMKIDYASGFLGALWGACIGAFIVWFFRIAGTLVFGRVAMGLGDVHLMFGVGAIIGALPSVAAFFLAPFFAILLHVWLLIIRGKRELPYGPYLSLATAFVLVFSCPIANWLQPGLAGLAVVLKNMFGA